MISSRKKVGRFLLTDRVTVKLAANSAAHRLLAFLVRICFIDDAKLYLLIPSSILMLFASLLLILSPRVVYSNEMTWDLLFNLEGAWRLYTGQVLHLDFHDVLGTLPFVMTVLGYNLVGVKPIAFVIGECILATMFTVIVIVAVKNRLPSLPACLFVFMIIVLALAPVTMGYDPQEFTFAMAYNRFGWIASIILFLLLFIEPCGRYDPVWTDLAAGFVLIVGLFYLKITYFGVAVAAIALALLTSHHIRRHWPAWCGVLALAILVALAPMNDGYRADIISGIASGKIHSNPFALVRLLALNGMEQIWVFGEIILLFYLSSRWCERRYDVLIGLFIWACGFFLLSQNAQAAKIPLYSVLSLLLYVRLGDWLRSATDRPLMLVFCLMTCALLPLLPPLFSNSLTLVGYNIKARKTGQTFEVTTTNLQGVVVPADRDEILDEVAAGWNRRDSFSRIRASGSGSQLSQHEYIKTILALADFLLKRGAASARIVVIDQVTPLPFVLGAPAPRGGNLWSGSGFAWRPPEDVFREADYVAIPRFPIERATATSGLEAYQEYLSARFSQRYETPYWTVLEASEHAVIRH